MTIITKPISDNKQDKPVQEKPLVVSVNEKAGSECIGAASHKLSVDPEADQDSQAVSGEFYLWSWASGNRTRRRISATTTVCAFVALMFLLTAAIIGGVYVYRQLTHSQMSRLRVWCGVPFQRNSLKIPHHQSQISPDSSSHWPSPFNTKDSMFNEQFDLDLTTNAYQEIYVPDFGIHRDGRFLHDLTENLTAIIDLTSKRCFVFPLDYNQVATPRNVFHVLKKLWRTGFYKGNMIVMRETLHIVRPPVKDLDTLGPYISKKCKGFTTFRLVKDSSVYHLRSKRAVAMAESAEYQQDDDHFTVVEFAGKNIIEYTVLDG